MSAAPRFNLGIHITPDEVRCAAVDDTGSLCSSAIAPISTHASDALREIMSAAGRSVDLSRVDAVNVVLHGSREGINPESLSPVGVVRISPMEQPCAQPLSSWPLHLAKRVHGPVAYLSGGHDFRAEEMATLDESGLREFVRACRTRVSAVAITGVGSTGNPDHELRIARTLRAELETGIHMTLAHEMGGVGLLMRENAAILNAALIAAHSRELAALSEVVDSVSPRALLHVAQQDGTLVSHEMSLRQPLMALDAEVAHAAGGALHLSSVDAAHVAVCGLDVVYFVLAGSNDMAPHHAHMSNVIPLGLAAPLIVSIAWEQIRDPRQIGLHSALAQSDLPVLVCGSEAPRLLRMAAQLGWEDRIHLSDTQFAHPSHIRAIGAATALAGGHVDRTVDFDQHDKDVLLAEVVRLARSRAVLAGADISLLTVEPVRQDPLGYTPGQGARIRVRARGPLLRPSEEPS